jgi:hypothetical protein
MDCISCGGNGVALTAAEGAELPVFGEEPVGTTGVVDTFTGGGALEDEPTGKIEVAGGFAGDGWEDFVGAGDCNLVDCGG